MESKDHSKFAQQIRPLSDFFSRIYCRETVAFDRESRAKGKWTSINECKCWSPFLYHLQFTRLKWQGTLKSLAAAAPVSLLWVSGCTKAVTPSHGFLWSVALVIGHNGIRWLLLHWRLQQKEVRWLLRPAEAVRAYQRSRPRATTRCDAAGSGKSLTSPRFFYFLFLTPSGSTNGSCPSKPSIDFFSVFQSKKDFLVWALHFLKKHRYRVCGVWALSLMEYELFL